MQGPDCANIFQCATENYKSSEPISEVHCAVWCTVALEHCVGTFSSQCSAVLCGALKIPEVQAARCVVSSALCVVCSALCVVCSALFVVCSALCVVCSALCVVCNAHTVRCCEVQCNALCINAPVTKVQISNSTHTMQILFRCRFQLFLPFLQLV